MALHQIEGGKTAVYSTLLKAKLHFGRVTESERDYEGSLAIDEDLMDAVGIVPFEKILVANVENGNRFETYAIPAPRGSRKLGLNGATTHKGGIGDRIIIFTFELVPTDKVRDHHPKVLILDEHNNPRGGVITK